MLSRIAVTIVALLISLNSLALSTEFGNGGNAIVCPLENSAIFYDSYEARVRYHLTPYFFESIGELSCETKTGGFSVTAPCLDEALDLVIELVARLRILDKNLEDDLVAYAKEFPGEMRLVDGDLMPVNDSGLAFYPTGCSLKQVALQHEPFSDDDKRYFISKSLWSALSLEDKAVLVLHEILYRKALELNPKLISSETVRYFNAVIISSKIMFLTEEQYKEIKEIWIAKKPRIRR